MDILNKPDEDSEEISESPASTARKEDDDEFLGAEQRGKLAQEGIFKIAHFLNLNDIDIRGVFEMLLYDEVVDGYELELLSFRQFKDFSMTLFGLDSQEIKALSIFIADYFVGESLDFKLLELIFTKMGI